MPTARRQFLRPVLVIAAGIALAPLLPCSPLAAAPQDGQTAAAACPAGPAFTPIGQITSEDGTLQAVMKVVNGKRNVPTKAGSPPTQSMLRYFDGYNPVHPDQKWPGDNSAAGPGPALRAEIGNTVQITLLNQVKVQDFAGTLDSGEEGRGNGCDQATSVDAQGNVDKNFYPANDKYPNCFHGSSSANIHFHGTHVTPSTTGDNVLVNVRPDQKVTEKDVEASFAKIFRRCDLGTQPKKWGDLPEDWRKYQDDLLASYDEKAPYKGGHGLPPELRLLPQNEQAIAQGVWPQWYIGSYPYCFQLPKYTETDGKSNVRMGQAPGTQWYHSHKHGSTSLNLFNGLAGAFIITDNSPTGYDGKLKAFYKAAGLELEEKVLVIQQITSVLGLLSAKAPGPPPLLVNGELTPTIEMRPGQVQLWRMINATVQAFINVQFGPAVAGGGIQYKRTAQDGVQLAWENYSNPENGTKPFPISPANRLDLLVQAPSAEGCYMLQNGNGTIAYVNVTGTTIDPAMGFPQAEKDYPAMPPFLATIKPETIRVRRELRYGSVQPTQPPTGRALIQFTIDGKQFEDQIIDQVMLLDSAEEWTIYNYDQFQPGGNPPIAHPFHIHINPFQITEIFNPNTMTEPEVQAEPYVWWDTFGIPPGKAGPDGKWIPGYFKMRSRFVDFTGRYVQHCHILAHEDRGMMQLLEVVDNKTILKHH